MSTKRIQKQTYGMWLHYCLIWSPLLLLMPRPVCDVEAVVFLDTSDPERNTVAPAGELADSGWQYLGQWGVFVGTVIGPHHFITARHVGGVVGQPFHYRGAAYTSRALYESGPVDLRIWEVCEPMPGPYAPLYVDDDELDRPLIFFGRGTQRGESVSLETSNGQELRGWKMGTADHRLRWGQNTVAEIVDYADLFESAEPRELVFLKAIFDREGGPNESHVSVGDSGGSVFIEREDKWCLAGILHGANVIFNDVSEGDGFLATLFDGGGFYTRRLVGDPIRRPRESNIGCDNLGGTGDEEYEWILLEDPEEDVANAFFAHRISNYVDWIQDVMVGLVEPCFQGPWAESSASASGVYHFDVTQKHDPHSRSIRIPIRGDTRFFRVTGCEDRAVKSVVLEEGFLVLGY